MTLEEKERAFYVVIDSLKEYLSSLEDRSKPLGRKIQYLNFQLCYDTFIGYFYFTVACTFCGVAHVFSIPSLLSPKICCFCERNAIDLSKLSSVRPHFIDPLISPPQGEFVYKMEPKSALKRDTRAYVNEVAVQGLYDVGVEGLRKFSQRAYYQTYRVEELEFLEVLLKNMKREFKLLGEPSG